MLHIYLYNVFEDIYNGEIESKLINKLNISKTFINEYIIIIIII